MRRILTLSALCISLLGASSAAALADRGAKSDAERRIELFDKAWGPEDPEVLEKFLSVRRAIKPRVEKYSSNLTQYALREVSTQSMLGPILMSVTLTRKQLEEALEAEGLRFEDYQRLTILVYGRWMRARSEEDPPEKRIVRTLQELAVALERQLEHREFEKDDERTRVEDRLASVLHQARFLAPYAFMNKPEVLESIDPTTRAWLEERASEVEELDYGIFDTIVPERSSEGAEG